MRAIADSIQYQMQNKMYEKILIKILCDGRNDRKRLATAPVREPKPNTMMYFHVIEEHGDAVAWQGCHNTKREAEEKMKGLVKCFPTHHFYIYPSKWQSEPIMTNC